MTYTKLVLIESEFSQQEQAYAMAKDVLEGAFDWTGSKIQYAEEWPDEVCEVDRD